VRLGDPCFSIPDRFGASFRHDEHPPRVTTPLSQHMIGITGEQLRRGPGVDKADAVGVVLRAVTTLITNASVAEQLLTQDPEAAPTTQT
jgi:DNA-binding transcriptional regulator LsrR (DeoR family)